MWAPWQNFFLPCLKLEKKWREGSHWRRRYEPPRTACERLCAPGMLPLKTRRQLRERRDSLDPFQLKDELEAKLKLILLPKVERPASPQEALSGRPQGGASKGSKARPPARLISLSKTHSHIKTQEPKHESHTTGLLRTPRCLFPVSQRAYGYHVSPFNS